MLHVRELFVFCPEANVKVLFQWSSGAKESLTEAL